MTFIFSSNFVRIFVFFSNLFLRHISFRYHFQGLPNEVILRTVSKGYLQYNIETSHHRQSIPFALVFLIRLMKSE